MHQMVAITTLAKPNTENLKNLNQQIYKVFELGFVGFNAAVAGHHA